MYQPLPSTFAAASAIIGAKKSERSMTRDVSLVRQDDRIIVRYGTSDVIAYNPANDEEPESIELHAGGVRNSVVRSLFNASLSGTGAVIGELPKATRDALSALGHDDEASGWVLFVPGKKFVPFQDGVKIPVLK